MKFRSAIIGIAAVILAGGAIISAVQGPQPCKPTTHGVVSENGRDKLVGMSDCKTGTVLFTLEGVPAELSVRNHSFGAWVITEDGKTVALQDVRI